MAVTTGPEPDRARRASGTLDGQIDELRKHVAELSAALAQDCPPATLIAAAEASLADLTTAVEMLRSAGVDPNQFIPLSKADLKQRELFHRQQIESARAQQELEHRQRMLDLEFEQAKAKAEYEIQLAKDLSARGITTPAQSVPA